MNFSIFEVNYHQENYVSIAHWKPGEFSLLNHKKDNKNNKK